MIIKKSLLFPPSPRCSGVSDSRAGRFRLSSLFSLLYPHRGPSPAGPLVPGGGAGQTDLHGGPEGQVLPARPSHLISPSPDRSFSEARHWSDDSTLGGRAFFQGATGRLILERLRAKDRGVYRCRVDFKVQPTTISRIELTVNSEWSFHHFCSLTPPPSPPGEAGDHGQPRGGGGAQAGSLQAGPDPAGQVLCAGRPAQPSRHLVEVSRVQSPPLSSLCVRENQVVDSSFQVEDVGAGGRVTNLLTLVPLAREDLGSILTCQASNSNLSLPVSTSVTLDLILPPTEVVILGAEEPLSAGKPHSLECRARGARPPPRLTWYLGQTEVTASQTGLTTSSDGEETLSTIEVTPKQGHAGQVLRCVARVPGLGHQDAKEVNTTIRVNFITRAAVELKEDTLIQGEDTSLTCKVDADPPPHEVTWEKDGVAVWQNVEAGAVITNMSLVLRAVERHRAGNYSCTATNTEGVVSSPARMLRVLYPPECENDTVTVLRAPLHRHTDVTCRVRAEPASGLSFRWAFHSVGEVDEVDIPGAQIRVTDGLSSVVDYVPRTSLDYGSLLCWAQTEVGEQTRPCRVELQPTTAPGPPYNCSLGPGSRVSCSPGQDGGLPQTFQLLATDSEGAVVANMSGPSPSFPPIQGLQPGLLLTVTASNSEGRSQGISIRSGPGRPVEGGPAQALPSLNTQGLRVTPLLGALIGLGGALGLLTLVLFMVLLCRRKRTSSDSTSSTYKMTEMEQDLKSPDLIQAAHCEEEEWQRSPRNENIYIVDPVYTCSTCSPYSTLQGRGGPPLPPSCSYSSLRPRPCPPACTIGESSLLLPPPSSLSSGLGSSTSDLDNSRSNSSDHGEEDRIARHDTAV